jgi:multimeric flavodoxin WrbA
MKPDDRNGHLPPDQRPFRVLIIAGSDRRQWDCPGVDSKARSLMFRMADRLPPEWEIDVEDLGNIYKREQIQSCNACVSTSMALCVWPCNCYEKESWGQPDLMWNLDLYARLDLADAWAIIGPVNWYAPSTNLKAMFDRLVCMSGGNPREDLIGHKDPARAIALEHSSAWNELSQNHLEGRSAAFFCYGDGGGDELDAKGKPKILRHKEWFNPDDEPFEDMRDTYAPLVWQCRYSGIEVPEALWMYCESGRDKKYSDNQAEDMVQDEQFMSAFDEWTEDFATHVRAKGPVTPNRYRAFGYRPPPHVIADLKTKWRGLRMALGFPPRDSSPAIQHRQNLNRDQRILFKRGEGEQ